MTDEMKPNSEQPDEVKAAQPETLPDKTGEAKFTQAQMDAILKDRLAREDKKRKDMEDRVRKEAEEKELKEKQESQ